MDLSKIFDEISDAIIDHPVFEDALEEIRDVIRLGRRKNAPCLHVSGPSGVGKTTLKEVIVEENPIQKNAVTVDLGWGPKLIADRVPVLIVDMPEEPTRISVCKTLLAAYGDKWSNTGNVLNLTNRLDVFIEQCQTTTIVMDEAQRLVDRDGTVVASQLLDLFKSRHSKHSISLIFLGLPRLRTLFQTDRQIERRWDSELPLLPYAWLTPDGKVDDEGQANFMGLLVAFHEKSTLSFAYDYTDYEVGKLFHYATGGITGNLSKLFLRLIRVLRRKPKNTVVTINLVATAFAGAFRPEVHGMANPFLPSFEYEGTPADWDDGQLIPRSNERQRGKGTRARQKAEAAYTMSKQP